MKSFGSWDFMKHQASEWRNLVWREKTADLVPLLWHACLFQSAINIFWLLPVTVANTHCVHYYTPSKYGHHTYEINILTKHQYNLTFQIQIIMTVSFLTNLWQKYCIIFFWHVFSAITLMFHGVLTTNLAHFEITCKYSDTISQISSFKSGGGTHTRSHHHERKGSEFVHNVTLDPGDSDAETVTDEVNYNQNGIYLNNWISVTNWAIMRLQVNN